MLQTFEVMNELGKHVREGFRVLVIAGVLLSCFIVGGAVGMYLLFR